MEIITFQMHKNLFLEINDQSGHWPMYVGRGLRTWAKACICRHKPAYATRVWNESHIVLEPFQTPFFPLYKALHGTFSKHRNPIEKT